MRRFTKAKAGSGNKAPKAGKKGSEAEDDAEGGVSPNPSTSLNENGSSNVPKIEDSDDEAETFEVEMILGSRVRHGKQQFKIRWKGYGPADDTWEDEENVDSPELIAAYLRGSPDEDKVKKTPKKNLKIPPRQKGKKRSNTSELKEKPAKKPKPENDDENAEWEVSKIVDYVELKDGTRQFLVRWKGFTSKENTWEPEANLNCADLIEKFLALKHQQDETTRETREVRKQVFKYNPELTKRSSQRSSTKRSGGDSSVDGPGNITSHSYFQQGHSSLQRSPINLSNMPTVSSWTKSRGSYTFSSKVNSPWVSYHDLE